MSSESPEKEKVLNQTVVKLGLVSFFADISSEMLYPITPLFLTTVLGASMSSVGFIEGLAEAVASLLKTYSAAWSDQISKRKPFMLFGYFLSALAKPAMGLAGSWTHVLVSRSLDRVGKGIRGAPRDALLAEAVSEKQRGAAFGWHRAMDTAGAALGPLIAIFYLNYRSDNLRTIYYLAAIPGFAAILFILALKEKKSTAAQTLTPKNFKLSWKNLPQDFKVYLISWGLFSLVNSSDVFLLLKAKQQGLSMTMIILMYCFYNLTYALLSPYFGKLSDQIPRKKVLGFGLAVFSFVYLGFSVATTSWAFWILFGIYGLYMATTDGVGKALAVDLIEKKTPTSKASALGLLGTVTGLAALVASTVGGALWEHFGSHWTFIYGFSGAAISLLILFFINSPNEI